MQTNYITHPNPTAAVQTNQAWYVHIQGKTVTPLFDYQNRAVGDSVLLALLTTSTPFNVKDFDITGLGYEDITIVVNDKWLAHALVACLNSLLPQASQEWVDNMDGQVTHVYAIQYQETAEEHNGEFYWVGGEEMTNENPIF